MAIRKLETTVFDDGVVDTPKRGVFVNKDVVAAFAQHGPPSKIFPLYLLISKNKKIQEFELPDNLPSLPAAEEVSQFPNLLDMGSWLDSIDCPHDAIFAAQIGKIIFDRLPESYKKKAQEVV